MSDRSKFIQFVIAVILPVMFLAGHCFAQDSQPEKPAKTQKSFDLIVRNQLKEDASETSPDTETLERIADYERFTAANPLNAVAFNNLGAMYVKAAMRDKAITAFREAIRINPKMSRAYSNLALTYEHVGRLTEAIETAKTAVAAEPESVRANELLCELYLAGKNYAAAVPCYETARRLEPGDASAEANYGASLLLDGQADKAIPVLQHAVSISPRFSGAFNALGLAQYQQKDYVNAALSFKQAVEADPGNANFRFNLAMAGIGKNDRFAALSQYNLLKTSNPELANEIYKFLYKDKILFVDKR